MHEFENGQNEENEENEKLNFPIIPLTLSLWLMQEESLDMHSSHYEYLQSLPSMKNFPVFYNRNEVEMLKGTPIYDKVKLFK